MNAPKMLASKRERAFDRVLEMIAAGTAMRVACKKVGMPNIAFYRMLREDSEKGRERANRYARAKEEQLEAFAADTIALADRPMLTRRTRRTASGVSVEVYDNVERARLAVETRKWHLAKLKPKVYGDRVEHDHKGSMELTLSKDEAKVL